MNKILMVVMISMLSMPVYANCGNDNGNGNGCSGNTGPQGPVGPQGPIGPQGPKGNTGNNGTNGATGTAGKTGTTGPQGTPGEYGRDATRANIGLEVRWYDAKHWALTSGYRYDTLHSGNTIDMAVLQIKIGKSYEEREIERLKKLLGVK